MQRLRNLIGIAVMNAVSKKMMGEFGAAEIKDTKYKPCLNCQTPHDVELKFCSPDCCRAFQDKKRAANRKAVGK